MANLLWRLLRDGRRLDGLDLNTVYDLREDFVVRGSVRVIHMVLQPEHEALPAFYHRDVDEVVSRPGQLPGSIGAHTPVVGSRVAEFDVGGPNARDHIAQCDIRIALGVKNGV